MIDEVIPPTILMFLGTFFNSVSTMIVIIASTPLFAVVIIPLAVLYYFAQVIHVIFFSFCYLAICMIIFEVAERWAVNALFQFERINLLHIYINVYFAGFSSFETPKPVLRGISVRFTRLNNLFTVIYLLPYSKYFCATPNSYCDLS